MAGDISAHGTLWPPRRPPAPPPRRDAAGRGKGAALLVASPLGALVWLGEVACGVLDIAALLSKWSIATGSGQEEGTV
ncbi:MAG TPA: hypothetical protein VIA81_09250 [Acidimicrobiia bacterium]